MGAASGPPPAAGTSTGGDGGTGGGRGASSRSSASGFANNVLFRSRLKRLQAALQAGASADSDLLLTAVQEATSPLVNELLPPGARAAERAWQLSQVAAGAYGL